MDILQPFLDLTSLYMGSLLYTMFFLLIFLPTSSILCEVRETLRRALSTLGPSHLHTQGIIVLSIICSFIRICLRGISNEVSQTEE